MKKPRWMPHVPVCWQIFNTEERYMADDVLINKADRSLILLKRA